MSFLTLFVLQEWSLNIINTSINPPPNLIQVTVLETFASTFTWMHTYTHTTIIVVSYLKSICYSNNKNVRFEISSFFEIYNENMCWHHFRFYIVPVPLVVFISSNWNLFNFTVFFFFSFSLTGCGSLTTSNVEY